MPGKAVGRAAVDLPWLCPNTDSLINLAEEPGTLLRRCPGDPALLTFLVRYAADRGEASLTPSLEQLHSPHLPETAAAYLSAAASGWLDPSAAVVGTIQTVVEFAAVIARRLAERTHAVSPEDAETVVRLAPLGWYAVASIDPSDAIACLHDPSFSANPAECQADWWGLDHDAIARRLVDRWRFPPRLARVIGSLSLPAGGSASAPVRDLASIAALALGEAQLRTTDLGLARCHDPAALRSLVGLSEEAMAALAGAESPPLSGTKSTTGRDPNPHHMPLIRKLLRMAGKARRRNGASIVVRLEERIDELQERLVGLAGGMEQRIQEAKLAALAELAAGAGHEINNPLAVISGNAQRLHKSELDADRAECIRSILRQTQRVASIIRDLMQFARPSRPQFQPVTAVEVLSGAHNDLYEYARERGVRLEIPATVAGCRLEADPNQIRQALAALVRNGIEAAGTGGWTRVAVTALGEAVQFSVEDSGPGLSPEAVAHAFDPFYCSRSAGRGRGLGLPTAWRLARQNGGEVRYEPRTASPTLFTLTIPTAEDQADWLERKSA